MSLVDLTAAQVAQAVRTGDLKAGEIVDAVLAQARATEGIVHGYISLLEDYARRQAERIDRADADTRAGWALAGVPIAVKDNLTLAVGETTAGSRILRGFRAPYTATAVARLEAAGAVVIGKTNLDEFAMGSSTEHSAFGPTKNPWDPDRVPGGSSGGSAAVVAARSATAALGSDTGGSIRQPAAFCGVVGLKPTYGRVSRYGLLAFASSLDQVGPIARTVEDVALLLQVMAGLDPRDATSLDAPVPDYRSALGRDIRGIRVGLATEYMDGVRAEVRAAVERAVRAFEDLGAQVETVSLPHTRYGISAYYLIAPAEASSNLARYDGVRFGYRAEADDLYSMYTRTRGEGFGAEVKRRILLGTYALSAGYYDAFYLKAQKVRTLLLQDFRRAFERVDLLLTPTTPEPAFRLGERLEDPWQMYLSDVMTVGVNLAGLPALSLPAAMAGGLPVGVQLIAPWLGEERLLAVARALESVLPRPAWPVVAAKPEGGREA
jgi:aspartyl-tRNA(Asn)/glutamyl-tRNA(Gln) amidotransferase subunit A